MSRIVFLALLLACSPSKKKSDSEESTPKTQASNAAADSKDAPRPAVAPEPATEPAGQSFQDGMQLICDSLEHVDATLSASDKQKAVATWIDENVTNLQVRELFSIMGDVPPSKRAGMMKAAAAKAGVTKCPIAEQ